MVYIKVPHIALVVDTLGGDDVIKSSARWLRLQAATVSPTFNTNTCEEMLRVE